MKIHIHVKQKQDKIAINRKRLNYFSLTINQNGLIPKTSIIFTVANNSLIDTYIT